MSDMVMYQKDKIEGQARNKKEIYSRHPDVLQCIQTAQDFLNSLFLALIPNRITVLQLLTSTDGASHLEESLTCGVVTLKDVPVVGVTGRGEMLFWA